MIYYVHVGADQTCVGVDDLCELSSLLPGIQATDTVVR